MSEPIKTSVNRGLAWLGVASSALGLLDILALIIILNTWVTTEQYGIATKAMWLFPVLDQVTDLGLGAAVIQRDDHTSLRISTVFWITTGLSLLLLGLIAFIAPIAASSFSGQPIVGWMLAAYGLKLVLQNGYVIPSAMMKRDLRFKEISIIRIIANLTDFVGKIAFAAAGFGIWCFVLGPLCKNVVYVVLCQMRRPYRPRFEFSFADAREYVTFGLRTSASQIMFFFYTNADYPIVSFYFGDSALGLYKLAYDIVLEPVRMLSNIVGDVAFPTFAKLRRNTSALIAQFISFTRLNLIIVMSFSAIVFVAASDLIALFPKYQGAERAMHILCAVAVFRAVGFVAPPLLDGLGHPERTLRYMTVATILMPLLFVLGAKLLGPSLGFESVAIAWAVGYPIAFAILIYLTTVTLGWSLGSYVRAVGGVALCMVGGGAVAGIVYRFLPAIAALRFAVTSGVVIVASALLLAYTQGLTLKSAFRSLRGS
ncbi:MAG TPA: oligosaccharide flippase family protein [Kofleriaceae bacterium]|jgi:O-antigen/teichoic acid export membrane protein